jgi:hypothetical protein
VAVLRAKEAGMMVEELKIIVFQETETSRGFSGIPCRRWATLAMLGEFAKSCGNMIAQGPG